jgi:TnpA family transposase
LDRHQEIILNNLGWRRFDEAAKNILAQEASILCSKQTKPRLMFISLVEFLRYKKIEVPTYHAISEIITKSLQDFEKNLIILLKENLEKGDQKILDELLGEDGYSDEEKENLQLKRYKLTQLKKSHQSVRPLKIKENINDLKSLYTIFHQLQPVISQLGLSSEIIQYYAQIVIKSKIFQMHQREEKRHLFLLAFVLHQFYQLNDLLIETLVQSVFSTIASSVRENKENFYEQRQSRHQAIGDISHKLEKYIQILEKIETTIQDERLSSEDKVCAIKRLLPNAQKQEYNFLHGELRRLSKESSYIAKNDDYYAIMESKSVRLQNRASDVIKYLEFDEISSSKKLIEAINYYKLKDGILSNPPFDFLDANEQPRIFDQNKKLRISLYKTLLFEQVASGIKSGALNLLYSYKYKTFDTYLISQNIWQHGREELLTKAGLLKFKEFINLELELKKAVKTQFKITNKKLANGKNSYASIAEASGKLKIQTPPEEKAILETSIDIFPKDHFVSLFEILSTIDELCHFTDSLEHWQVKYNREKPSEQTFFAGIIGYGCNLGIRKVSRISRNINSHELENTVNWYFTHENLLRANDKILAMIEKLQLPKLFQKNKEIMHTSSDGQKFNISVESLNASYSYKYFGKGKGVSVYSFIDECHRLFYSTVINSSEREAAYVIDGLLHNEVVQSDIHSTDTHGYSEIIFAVTHLLGISFAPRIKDFRDQNLYSFDAVSDMKNLGYKILPAGKINIKIIEEQWDDILRLVTTIKLKESSASQLFRRLSSYSRQHPLYRALKEFGRVIKTLFLLRYIDDLELRQSIEKQLNKLESSNKFAKAVFYGNNQEFQQSTKDEQLIADGCKRLIENAIICWNYLYLSQKVIDTKTEKEKQNLLEAIKSGSVVAWQHVNLQGEYDFSEEILKNSIKFQLPELMELKIA